MTPVLNKFKNKKHIERQTLIARSASWYELEQSKQKKNPAQATMTPKPTTQNKVPINNKASFPELPQTTTPKPQTAKQAWEPPRNNHANPSLPTNKSDTENPLKEMLELLRTLDLGRFFSNLKDTIPKIKSATFTMDKLFIIIEAVGSLFDNA